MALTRHSWTLMSMSISTSWHHDECHYTADLSPSGLVEILVPFFHAVEVFLLNFQTQPSFLTNVNNMFSEQTSWRFVFQDNWKYVEWGNNEKASRSSLVTVTSSDNVRNWGARSFLNAGWRKDPGTTNSDDFSNADCLQSSSLDSFESRFYQR